MASNKQSYITFGNDGKVLSKRSGNQSALQTSGDKTAGQAADQASQSGDSASEPHHEADVAYRPSRAAAEASRPKNTAPNAVDSAGMTDYITSQESKEVYEASANNEEVVEEEEEFKPVLLVVARGRLARKMLEVSGESGFSTCAVYTQDHARDSYLKSAHQAVCLGETYSPQLFCNSYAVLKAAEECDASAILLCEESLPLAEIDSFLARAAARDILVFKVLAQDASALGWVQCTTEKPPITEDHWRECPHCGLTFDANNMAAVHYSCPSCGGYLRMNSQERIADLLDAGSFHEWDRVVAETDPLDFPGYSEKLEKTREATGLEEAVRTGEGRIAGLEAAFGFMESTFFMGSMGSVVGEKLSRLFDRATERHLPVVIFTASGGARMQEGLISLMQMAKVSCAVERHSKAGLLYISVITDPTTGGVTASFATEADIILAEPGALIGFAGQRVIRDTIRQELPEGFQTAEFALAHGLIDAIVTRDNLRETLANLLALHLASANSSPTSRSSRLLINYSSVRENLERGGGTYNMITYGDLDMPVVSTIEPGWTSQQFQKVKSGISGLFNRSDGVSHKRLQEAVESGSFDAEGGASLHGEVGLGGSQDATAKKGAAPASTPGQNPAWDSVMLARNTHRPTALSYIRGFVDGFVELHGDRSFGDDAAIVGGIGWIDGRPVTVIATEKGADLNERIRRNFGCPQPEGYRKSLRLMRQAEKFHRPVVCIVDTQGAFCGTESEERGQGNAIADNLVGLAGLRVPVVSVFVGEGGSGGALALALADRVAMQEHAVYSILSPEGFASILWKDRTRAPEAATVMKMSAADAYEMGIVDAVLSEGPAPAHENPDVAIENVHAYVSSALAELADVPADKLVEQRQERFGRF